MTTSTGIKLSIERTSNIWGREYFWGLWSDRKLVILSFDLDSIFSQFFPDPPKEVGQNIKFDIEVNEEFQENFTKTVCHCHHRIVGSECFPGSGCYCWEMGLEPGCKDGDVSRSWSFAGIYNGDCGSFPWSFTKNGKQSLYNYFPNLPQGDKENKHYWLRAKVIDSA